LMLSFRWTARARWCSAATGRSMMGKGGGTGLWLGVFEGQHPSTGLLSEPRGNLLPNRSALGSILFSLALRGKSAADECVLLSRYAVFNAELWAFCFIARSRPNQIVGIGACS
jgi:hypothetical protein